MLKIHLFQATKESGFYLSSLFVGLILLASPICQAETVQRDFNGFKVWIDCDINGAVRFAYTVTADSGSLDRRSSFSVEDDELPDDCHQTSSGTYKVTGTNSNLKYDRGHLVPANHLDHLPIGIHESNTMTNILPQARKMNRGAWRRTEDIIECHREESDLQVIGGVIWGFNPHDDFFVDTHGVATPDYFWKVVISDDDAIAWIVPNSHDAATAELDEYLISVGGIEKITGEDFELTQALTEKIHNTSWPLLSGCNIS